MTNGNSAFACEYKYQVAGQTYRSVFSIFKDFKAGAQYKNGDSVEVLYDPKEPLVHTDKIKK